MLTRHTPETMKTIIATLILSTGIALSIHAAPPLPATSTVELRMTRTVEIVKEPTKEEERAEHAAGAGHVCFGNRAHYSLEPVFRRGLDAKSSKLLLSIYIITTDTERKFAILKPKSQIIPSDSKTPLIADNSYQHLIQWRCKCRTRGDTMSKEPEWYVEVIQDGKVLCSNQSKNNTTIKKLVMSRVFLSEIEVNELPIPQSR